MSTALAASGSASTSQLCFSWMQSDLQPLSDRVLPCVTSQSEAVVLRRVALSTSAAPVKNRRVGEVRLGQVMISLLKRYGITDEEIAAGIAEYARDNPLFQAG